MNVAKNISFGLEMRRVPKAERDKAVAEAARTLQIEHLLQRRPGQLSGGQRQRVAMGRALVRNAAGSSCSTSRSPTSTPSCGSTCAPRSALAPAAAHHGGLCHPRPDRGDDARHHDRRAEGRRHPAGRLAVADLQQPDQHVRRRLHGLAGDEPDAGVGAQRRWPPGGRGQGREGRRAHACLAAGAWRHSPGMSGARWCSASVPRRSRRPSPASAATGGSRPPTAWSRSSSRPALTPS